MPWATRGEIVYEGEMMTMKQWRIKLDQHGLTHNEMVSALNCSEGEIAVLRNALQLIANHTPDPGTALETVVKFAAATLEGVK